MDLFIVSISLCNISQKGHTSIKEAFTKGSIMEFFLKIERGIENEKKEKAL